MKYKWIGLAALALACVQAQTTNITTNLTKVPEGAPIPIAWEDSENHPDDIVGYSLYSGTNFIYSFNTNAANFTLVGATNGVHSYKGTAPAFVKGTNMLTLAAINIFTNQSTASPILGLKVLGKPSPPQAPRKL